MIVMFILFYIIGYAVLDSSFDASRRRAEIKKLDEKIMRRDLKLAKAMGIGVSWWKYFFDL